MKQFYALEVVGKQQETRDSVRIALSVPEDLQSEFSFLPGQHVPVQIEIDGRKIRRTYSICSEQGTWPFEIGIRVQPGGQFSTFAAEELQIGDTLDVMPPNGQFHVRAPQHGRHYLGFAAGSGITPILSIITAILRDESDSRFALFYGNRKQSTTMFIDDLYALKNRYPGRLQLHFVFSQEEQEFDIASGRFDAEKIRELYQHFCDGIEPDEAFVCGPDTMIDTVSATLAELGMASDAVHAERFGAPRKGGRREVLVEPPGVSATVTVIMDGHRKSFDMQKTAANIVDAAAEQGVELPYSCKGGVCATCRTHVQKGAVDMATNYGLEPWEVEQGFVLACQSVPTSDAVTLNYDKT